MEIKKLSKRGIRSPYSTRKKFILSKYPKYKIDGFDMAPNMIELAKTNNPAAKFIFIILIQMIYVIF